MKDALKAIKILDVPIMLFIAFITVFSFFYIYALGGEASNVIIKYKEKEWIYPIDKDLDVEIEGAIGITKIRIKDKQVLVLSSACPHKTCIACPPLKKVGDWNACLPNQVFLYIKKKGDRL